MTTDTPPHSCRVLDLEITDDGTAMVCPHGYRVGIPGPAVIDGQPVHLGAPEPTHLTPVTAPPTEYVPTTEQVAEAWTSRYDGEHTGASGEERRGYDAEFDRWLAAHDREVAARALRTLATDLGHAEGCHPDPDRDPYLGCRCRLTALYARATRIEAGEADV